jgi:glycerol-3-phosphate dehydrogenase
VLNRCRRPADGDIIVPHEREVILGTTSVEVDDPDEYEESEWEIETIVAECAKLLPAVAERDITRTYWGVRPLYAPDEDRRTGRAISRDFFLIDHANEGVENFASIVGGKLTTHRLMAEATADHVCAAIGVDVECRTDAEPLLGSDDPTRLNELAREFDAHNPADADVVGE